LAQCDPGTLPNGLVLWSRDWHLGVVGIVASRLVDRFHRPAIVMAVNDQGVGRGSARGVPGFDLYAALTQCQDLLEGYGGHPGAAGLTIREDRLPAFAERFAAVVAEWTGDRPSRPLLHVDAEVSLREVDARLVRELDQLHPFGAGNPEPTLAVRNLSVLAARLVGDNHLKMMVRHEGSPPFESIGFRMGSLDSLGLAGSPSLDLVFVPEFNRWNGLDRIQLRIRDVRASGMV
ncbi:MAG: DHHA1 domain-containing protein, partial [Nitrospirales bacterium]